MPLVDYGGSSDSEVEQAPHAIRKKTAGPKKIMLDLPKPSATPAGDDGPPKKRPKLSLGSGRSGLAGMLPAPKLDAPIKPPAAVTQSIKTVHDGIDEDDVERKALKEVLGSAEPSQPSSMIPASVKGKEKVASTTTDFFGIGTSSRPMQTTSASQSTAIFLNAAPKTVEKEPSPPPVNYYATLPPPSAADPYPGFHALESGQWAANRPEEWAAWCRENGMSAAGRPLETPEEDKHREMVDIEGVGTDAGGQEASKIPSKIVDAKGIPEKAVIMGGRGGNKHQLSSLLYQAHANRQELEEKIAQAKANRKSGGTKYGAHARLFVSISTLMRLRRLLSFKRRVMKEQMRTSRL